jgi:hypothetical protein
MPKVVVPRVELESTLSKLKAWCPSPILDEREISS